MNMRLTILILVVILTSGCIGIPPTEVPLPSIETANPGARNDTLIIMLPGRGDRANTFIDNEFQKMGKDLGFDTIAVDAHFGYYMKRSLLPRLHEDIVLPAREAGYKNVWLLGISMGGFGSLLYASENPDQVDGVILLAPFLGDESSLEEIAASGGLDKWDASASRLKDYEIGVWTWLRDTDAPVILGYGESDGMAEGYRLVMTDVVGPSNVYTLEGGHKWTAWKPLWNQIAAELDL
jgi:pimeloyl-ACP methyl ester carboxylesterase